MNATSITTVPLSVPAGTSVRAAPDARVFQILNHYTSPQDLDPGFGVLDNSANPRPDWYEYWPIRNFLLSEPLDEAIFYGFLSPKFKHKTRLGSADVYGLLSASENLGADVLLVSPSVHNGAFFLNVFEHGEHEHPGLLSTAQRLLDRVGAPADLGTLVTNSRNTVHSNYFIAKPRFWRAWLNLTEAMFRIAEDPSDPLGRELCAPTNYRGRRDVQMKIFVMERIASFILATDESFRARVRDPFVARSRHYKLPAAIVCDALKIAYATQRREQYKEVFLLVRNLRRLLNLQVRVAARLGAGQVRRTLNKLQAYWHGK